MTISPDSENRLICPSCQALNAPHARICSSCGVNIEDFRSALPRLQQIMESHTASHLEKLEDEKTLQIQDDVKKSQKAFQRLLLFLLLGILITGLLVSGGAVLYANRVKQTQEEIKTYYEESLACLQAQKYLCARDGFRVLLATDSGMPNVLEYLNQAQLGLAQQYFYSGQWEDTVNELDDLLQRDPGNQEAVALLKVSYDRWIDQLRLEGSWFKRWTVRKERDARFPLMDR